MTNSPHPRFLTTREATDRARYSRCDSFLRAWRAAGLPTYRRPSGRTLIAAEDFERFVRRDDSEWSDEPGTEAHGAEG